MRYSCAVTGCDNVGRHWWNKVKGVRKPVRMANLCLDHRNARVALLAGRDPDDPATQLPTLAEIAKLVEARRAAKEARLAAAEARRRTRRPRKGSVHGEGSAVPVHAEVNIRERGRDDA